MMDVDNQASLTIEQQNMLIEALGFYADPATYFAITVWPDRPAGAFADDMSVVDDEWGLRPGKHARDVLKQLASEMDVETDE